jgi:Protein of unknown function (DUF3106)
MRVCGGYVGAPKVRLFKTYPFVVVITAALLSFAGFAHAQNAASVTKPITKPILDKLSTAQASVDHWQALTPAQKTALQPLSANWGSLTEGQKRKWIAVSANFAQFSPKDKETLHSRMTEWAGLTAKQREQARINFAQTKTLTPSDKQAKWETYKALPPETKQALANINVAPKPTGAATAPKPIAKDKLVASKPNTDKATVR